MSQVASTTSAKLPEDFSWGKAEEPSSEEFLQYKTSAEKSDSTYNKYVKYTRLVNEVHPQPIAPTSYTVNISLGTQSSYLAWTFSKNWTLSITDEEGEVVAECPISEQWQLSEFEREPDHSYWRISKAVATDEGDFIFVAPGEFLSQDVYYHDRNGNLDRIFSKLVRPILTKDRMIDWRFAYTEGWFKIYNLNGKELAHRVIDGFKWELSIKNDEIHVRNTVFDRSRTGGYCSDDRVYSMDGVLLNKD